MVEYGEELQIHYPINTDVRFIGKAAFRERRLIVARTRDLVTDPLSIVDFLRRPYIRRSRYLVRAWDCEKRYWRQFYLGSSTEYSAPGHLRLALYREDSTRPDEIVSRGFEPSVLARRDLIRFINRFASSQDKDVIEQMRVVCDDLALRV